VLSLIVVARRRAHVHSSHLPLPSQVDCCLFTPLAVGGGVWGHHMPLLFSGLAQLPLIVALKMSHRGWSCVWHASCYRRHWGISTTSRQISFEFLFIKTCPPDKLHNGLCFVIQFRFGIRYLKCEGGEF
jgi:hypothetical protein